MPGVKHVCQRLVILFFLICWVWTDWPVLGHWTTTLSVMFLYHWIPDRGVSAVLPMNTAATEGAPVYCSEWKLKMRVRKISVNNNMFVPKHWSCCRMCNAILCLSDLNYFLQLVALKGVEVKTTGSIWRQVGPNINHVGSFSPWGDNIKALSHQVVAWYKRSRLTLSAGAKLTGEDKGLVREEEEEAQVERE